MTQVSDVVVSQLGIAEQLMLWALRQRRADSGATTPELVQGFLLACGLAGSSPRWAASSGCSTPSSSTAAAGSGRCAVRWSATTR